MSTGPSVKRVLVYRLGSLGDTVVALPAFHLIAEVFPNAERRLLTNIPVATKAAPAQAILENSGLIDSYSYYAVGERNFSNLLQLRNEIRKWQPEVLVYLAGYRGMKATLRDWLFFHTCGVHKFYGFPFQRNQQHPRWLAGENAYEHISSLILRVLAESFGESYLEKAANWSLNLTAIEESTASKQLEPIEKKSIIAICIGTKIQAKDWGARNWHDLLERISELYSNHAMVMIGAKEEYFASERVAEGWNRNTNSAALNLCGLLSPRESAAVLARADLYLGHDSGPMHLAAAVGTRCVAVFAARNLPEVWYPDGELHHVLYHHVDCAGCGLDECIVQEKKCILSISVDEVLCEVRKAIAISKQRYI